MRLELIAPFNDVGLLALDVRHGKAIFAGVGVGTTALLAAIDFRYAGRNHADVVNKAEDKIECICILLWLTTTERGNLVGMQQGAMVYDSDLDTTCFYNGSAWRKVTVHSSVNIKTYTYLCMDCKSDYIFFKRQ